MNKEFFRNPVGDPDYTIGGFWFWNDLITDEKTTEQLNMMNHIHANQPVVHARFGLENEYLSKDWFDRIGHVMKECQEKNMKIWLYDENNWPSGNCNWTITMEEEYREHFLQFEQQELKVGEKYRLDLGKRHYINVSAYNSKDERTDLLNLNEKVIKYTALEDITIYGVYVDVDEYEPVGKLCVDYLSKKAIGKFIETTHELYADNFQNEFGKIITGIFMDETRFCNAMPWTKTLLEEFQKRKGYDLLPYLPLLIRKTEESVYIRYDYFDVISDMYTEATFKQIYDWCETHGLKTTAHFLGEETLATQSYFGGDMVRGYKYLHVPAIDHLGNGIGSLDGKFAVSASHNYGKSRISCEAFGAAGWDMDFESMVKISNWLFQQGINLIWMHGFYYSIKDERSKDFPPSYFYQWKYWDHMPMYSKMAARMSELLSNGCQEAEILVYSPMETFWNYYEPDLDIKTGFWEEGPFITDEKAKFIDNQFQLVCNKLVDINYDFNILGSDAIDNFEVEDGKIVNKLNKETFSVFVLPLVDVLPDKMVTFINEFTMAGGKVISYYSDVQYVVNKNGKHMTKEELPKLDTTNIVVAKKISNIVEECKKSIHLPFEITCGVDEVAHTKSSYPARLIDPYIHDGETLYGIGVTRYLKDGDRILNFTNYNDKDEDLKIFVESLNKPEILIPETGKILSLDKYEKRNDGYEFNVTIPKNRTYFIVCKTNLN